MFIVKQKVTHQMIKCPACNLHYRWVDRELLKFCPFCGKNISLQLWCFPYKYIKDEDPNGQIVFNPYVSDDYMDVLLG